MKFKVISLMLFPFLGQAAALPSLTQVPIMSSLVSAEHRVAANKFQEALFIQTGVSGQYGTVDAYLSKEIDRVTHEAESDAAEFIDSKTPLSSRHVFFVMAAGYMVTIKKEFTQHFKNPLFNNVNHTVVVGEKYQALGVQIPF